MMMMMLLLFVIRLLSLLPLSLSLSLLHVLFPLSRFLGSIAALLSHTLQQNRRNNPIGSYANFKVLVSGNQIALTVINLQCILMHCHLPHPYPYPLPVPPPPTRPHNLLDLLQHVGNFVWSGRGSHLSFTIPACHTLSTYKHLPSSSFASSRLAVQISSHSWRILSHTSLSFYGDISRIFVSHSRISKAAEIANLKLSCNYH